jgi:hypothetical protein
MTQQEKKVHDLVKKLHKTLEKDEELSNKFANKLDEKKLSTLDDGCYYVQIPGGKVFKICP